MECFVIGLISIQLSEMLWIRSEHVSSFSGCGISVGTMSFGSNKSILKGEHANQLEIVSVSSVFVKISLLW